MIADVPSALLSGAGLGFAAGVSPGPLLALVVSQTLAHSVREGIKVALAPVLTDLPILFAVLFLMRELADRAVLMAAISLCGGLFLAWQGWQSLTWKAGAAIRAGDEPHSLRKGVAVNLLNPYTYLFWTTVGGPLLVRSAELGWAEPLAFAAGFFGSIVGAKVAVAAIAGRSRQFLAGRAYRAVMRLLGLALVAYGALFVREAWRYLVSD
jgi:threonine/homoserine/homoserine lactone efflux protein